MVSPICPGKADVACFPARCWECGVWGGRCAARYGVRGCDLRDGHTADGVKQVNDGRGVRVECGECGKRRIFTPVAQTIVPAGRTEFQATFARRAEGRERLYEKFLATEGGQTLGAAHYVNDFEFAADNNYPYPRARSIKGVQPLELEDDAEETGTRHAGLNVVPSLFMLKQAGDAATTITFHFDGADYYFDRSQIEALDHRTLVLTHDDIQVHFVVYLLPNASATSAASILIHPDADTTQGGPVYGFNTKTEEGIRYVTAVFAFLAQRYTRTDERYGRAVDFIIGNEIDSMWAWQNMGEQTLSDFVEYYTRALRLAYLAMRSA